MAYQITLIDERETRRAGMVDSLRRQGYRVNPSRRLTLDPGLLDAPRQDALIVNLAFSRNDPGLQAFRLADPSMVVVALSDVSPPSSDPYVLRHPVHAVLPQLVEPGELMDVLEQELEHTGRSIHRIEWSDRSVDLAEGILQVGASRHPLTTNECALIRYLAGNAERAVSRGELLTRVWGYREGVYTRAVDSTVKRLRPKLEVDPKNPGIIRSVRGVGYQINLVDCDVRRRGASEIPSHVSSSAVTPPPIPALPGSFFGRGEDLVRLDALLSSGHRLVTVTGPGGMGKTRLVREWAIGKGDNKTWFVDLSEAYTDEDLVRTAARTLFSEASQGTPDTDTLVQQMASLDGHVVVLDNLEQVAASAGAFLEQLLMGPGPQFLCTSTTRLGRKGEACLELAPLANPQGLSMLVDRVESLRGQPIHETTEVVSAIVRHLEGHPLAIELAASRSRLLSLAEVYQRLKTDTLALSGTPHRGAPDQPIGLETVIAWSWSLLSPEEQQVLTQCAVFRGGFSADAAMAVVQVPGVDAFDVIQRLRDHSFLHLVPRTDGRLRLNMYRSIAEFVERKLRAATFREATEERHRDHYLGLFEPMMRYDRGMMLASRFSRSQDLRRAWADEQENVLTIRDRYRVQDVPSAVKAALVWDWLASLFSTPSQRELVLQDALVNRIALPSELQIELAIAMGQLQFRQGRVETAAATLSEVLPLADGDPQSTVDLHRALGWAMMHAPSSQGLQNIREAARYFDQALAHAGSAGLDETLGEICHDVGRCQMLLAEPTRCLEAFQRGLQLALQNGDPGPICHAEYSLGMFHLQLGNGTEAEAAFQRLEERTRQMGGDKWREVRIFQGSALVVQGRLADAIRLLEGLVPQAHRVVDPGHRVFVGLELALCHQLSGQYDQALALYKEHMPSAIEDGGVFTDALHSNYEALCKAQCGQPIGTPRHFDHGSLASESLSMRALMAVSVWVSGGRTEEGQEAVRQALEALEAPVHGETTWTHVQLNLTARIVHGMASAAIH